MRGDVFAVLAKGPTPLRRIALRCLNAAFSKAVDKGRATERRVAPTTLPSVAVTMTAAHAPRPEIVEQQD
jgi:hypothetical protein